MEIWRPVPDYPDYDVSSLGRVMSRRRGAPRLLRLGPDSDGYLQVHLSNDDGQRLRKVHHLVLEAFVGPRPDGTETRHLNRDKLDNRPENLLWDTACEDGEGRAAHRVARGVRNGRARFTELEVMQIRADLATGQTHAAVARRLGVPVGTVEDIGRGRSWAHLGGPITGRQPAGREQRITQAQVDEVRRRVALGDAKRTIAREVGVSYVAVFRIINDQLPPRRG